MVLESGIVLLWYPATLSVQPSEFAIGDGCSWSWLIKDVDAPGDIGEAEDQGPGFCEDSTIIVNTLTIIML